MQQEVLLLDLEKQAAEFKVQGNAEAASRLQQQIQILRVCLLETVA